MKEFEENLDTPVYTSKYVVEYRKLISYISHDEDDGAWQFHASKELKNEDEELKMVRLGDIISIDPTVQEMSDLPEGFFAVRESKEEGWEVYEQDFFEDNETV